MFSVNTNNGAFIALQNLSTTNRSISEVQNRINTGLKVSSAKDDSATYAIAQNLRGDVSGINAVRTSLDRAKSSLDVAVQAGEAISDLLNRAREITVAASDQGLDSNSRTAMNNDFKALMNQISSVVGQAEFNGTNLIKASPDSISAITSVKQNSTVDRISVAGANLNTNSTNATVTTVAGAVTVGATDGLNDLIGKGGADAGAIAAQLDANSGVVLNDDGTISVTTGGAAGAAAADGVGFTAGGAITLNVGGKVFTSAASANAAASTTYTMRLSDFTSSAGTSVTVGAGAATAATKNAGNLDLTKAIDRSMATAVVDSFRKNVSNSLASFGSASRQIDIQQQFARKISDSIETGIGNLVDADLARESARLQSLQVKQQLGLQALSIANQSPQSVLGLFR
jgi:flagellin